MAWPVPGPSTQDKALNPIALNTAKADDSAQRLEQLADTAQRMLERARQLGASQAEVSCNEDSGLEVNVRLGQVETVQSSRDRGLAIIMASHDPHLVAEVATRTVRLEGARLAEQGHA